jgi:lysozyme
MTPAAILTTTAAAVLLYAATSSARANVEAGEGGASFDLGNITDTAETLMNQITEQAATTSDAQSGSNIAAFLGVIKQAEGTANSGDAYRVCYGYAHTIANDQDHPAITGEWRGERLPDAMCKNAGFGPGCVSTAAGAYQIIRPTWATIKAALSLPDFGPASQDAAAVELIRRRGALEDVKAGRIAAAINKCRNEWASLPGNYAKQGQRSADQLVAWYQQNGGNIA